MAPLAHSPRHAVSHSETVSIKVLYEEGYRMRRVTFNVIPTEMLVSQTKHMVLNLLNTNLRNRGKLRPHDDYILVYDGHILVEDRTLQENQFWADQIDAVFEVRLCTRDQIDSTYYMQRLVEKKTAKHGGNTLVPRSPFACHERAASDGNNAEDAPAEKRQRTTEEDAATNVTTVPADPSANEHDAGTSDPAEANGRIENVESPTSSSASQIDGEERGEGEGEGGSSDERSEKPKKKKKKQTNGIKLRIQEIIDGNQIGCDISASSGTRFRKIANMYCAHRGYKMGDFIFACDSIMMEDSKTLAALGLNNSDEVYLINVFHHSMVNIEE